MTARTIPAPALTDDDRATIATARDLAAYRNAAAIRELTGESDITAAYANAFGRAQVLLEDLAAVAERLGGAEAAAAVVPVDPPGREML